MISITARISGLGDFRRVVSINYTLPQGTTVDTFLGSLVSRFGDEVFNPSVLVAVNSRVVREAERGHTVLQDGDVVSVIRAFAGG